VGLGRVMINILCNFNLRLNEGSCFKGCTHVAGARPYGMGHMAGAQYTTVSGQVNLAHAPPMVRTGAWE
jgi:hypothetical protein